MPCVTACKFTQTFNKKSSILVNTGAGLPTRFDTRINNDACNTPNSGTIEANYGQEFRQVYYYGNPSGTY